MLLLTNSYNVPADKRTEHTRLAKRFQQAMARLGCEDFEVFEQTGLNWSNETTGRFVQIMRFRDLAHFQQVQDAEQHDPAAREIIGQFLDLVGFAEQVAQKQAFTSYYQSSQLTMHRLANEG
jgi:hypothetical protein